ncbi:MAG: hydroxymethylglutaryl-CoA reductase [Bacteroidia bacterium]|nr:hydroxymethylglutaryl-CoA reductase [Bacteroidia bacterium]
MSTSSEKARKLIKLIEQTNSWDSTLESLNTGNGNLTNPLVPGLLSWSKESFEKRLEFIKSEKNLSLSKLSGKEAMPEDPAFYQGNIENFIGMTQVPTGLVGPLLINGILAKGDFYVPLATSEGALVASYSRGARATRLSGGITSICLTEAVQRTPVFKFNSLPEVGKFMYWILDQVDIFREIIKKVSSHAQLLDLRLNMEGNQVLCIFDYTTGDAAGQNMVTLCTETICNYIIEHTPIQPQIWFLESNYSGDKKATVVSFSTVRGKKVTAEAVVKAQIVKEVLYSTPEQIASYWQTSTLAAIQSGSIGVQGHFANALTALFLACGQDVACVSEAYVGITRMEVNKAGDLYVTVTLPSLVVGTVGGGTRLPTQRECLELLGCYGEGGARKFAEICGAIVLAGELSIAAALASGSFAKAHRLFGRKQ